MTTFACDIETVSILRVGDRLQLTYLPDAVDGPCDFAVTVVSPPQPDTYRPGRWSVDVAADGDQPFTIFDIEIAIGVLTVTQVSP